MPGINNPDLVDYGKDTGYPYIINYNMTIPCHYSLRALYIRWYSSEDGVTPEFEDCTMYSSNFINVAPNGEMHFYGTNRLYNCDFLEGQVIVLHGDLEVYNCQNVTIKLADTDVYHNIIADGSNVKFTEDTNSNAASYNVNLKMTGGMLTLPLVSTNTVWSMSLANTKVYAGDYIYAGIDAVNCTVYVPNIFYFRKAEGCTICFTGSESTFDIRSVSSVIGCEIKHETEDGIALNYKTSATFGALICIGNDINHMATVDGKVTPITMSKSAVNVVCANNTNGVTTF